MIVAHIGTGMIARDQTWLSVLQLKRLGHIDAAWLVGRSKESVDSLLTAEKVRMHFPDFADTSFRTFDGGDTAYADMLKQLSPGNIVIVAVPDAVHAPIIEASLKAKQHVICVKPLTTCYADSLRIQRLARQNGLFVGVDYHKAFDSRVQVAIREWGLGKYGKFRDGCATMIEDDGYLNSAFWRHFRIGQEDPIRYVGCHYLHQLWQFTKERPVWVSAACVEGHFNDAQKTRCYTWGNATFRMEGGGLFTLTNGLAHPATHAARNHQGIELWGEGVGNTGTYFHHVDNRRGMDYVRDPEFEGGGKLTDAGTDYMVFLPRLNGESGSTLDGYGYRSIATMVDEAKRIAQISPYIVGARQALDQIDRVGIIPTPETTAWIELVQEAIALSVENDGRRVLIDYGLGAVSLG